MQSFTNGRRWILMIFLLFCRLNCVYSRRVLTMKLSSVDSSDQTSVKVIGTVPESSFKQQSAITTAGVGQLNPVHNQMQDTNSVQAVQHSTQGAVRQEQTQKVTTDEQTPVQAKTDSKGEETTDTVVAASKDKKTKGNENIAEQKPDKERPAVQITQNEKPATQKPLKEKPDNEKLVQQKQAEEKPAEEKPAEEKPAEEKPAEEKPAEEKPAKEKPKNENLVAEKPTTEKPVEEKPVEEKPVEEKPAEEKPTEEKPAEEKPAEEKPENEKTVEEKVENEKSTETTITVEEAKVDNIMSKVSGRKICNSPHCLKVALGIKAALNASADPCDNFYNYACGNWIRKHKIPKSHTQYSRISELSNNNEKILLEALKADQDTDNENLRKIKLFFRSCMDVKTIDHSGNAPLKEYIKSLGSWSLDKHWNSKSWNFYKTLRKMHQGYPAEVFFTVDVHTDPTKQNSDANYIIMIDEATLNLPQIVYFTSPKILRLVSKYMVHIIGLSGVDEKIAKTKVREIMKFEARLATISVPKIAKKYVRIPLEKLVKAIPEFPWMEHLRGIFWPRPVRPSTRVIVLANDYLPNMFELLRKTNKSVLSNYMMWRLVKDVVPLLSKDFRKEHFALKKTLLGAKHDKPREKKCFGYTNNLLGPLMGALFIKNAFSPESKHKVETMMEGIVKAFKNNIENVDWVDNQTVAAVEEKADEAVYKVGYPEYLSDEKKFNERYDKLNITEGAWFNNVLETDKFASLQTYQKLDTVSDKHQWITVPHLVNAFYVITKNEIVVPSGILQPPFFYPEEIPRALSYGAIGHVLGHELTHGFDTTGRKFDKDGEEINFRSNSSKVKRWSRASIKMFGKRAKCLVEQFSKFRVLNKFHVDGYKTLGENIADGGGVKLAYHAFRDFLETHNDEEILPLLDMPHEQLFFLGYAQKECVRTKPAAEFLAVMEDVHPLSKFRVIGTLSNMEEFSKVYKCKKGDKMNPEKKCEVW